MAHYGVDWSAWNDGNPVDYNSIVSALEEKGGETPFAIVKLTQGTAVNPRAHADVAGFRAAGADVQGYFFLEPANDLGEQIAFLVANSEGVKTIWVDSELTDGLPWSVVTDQTHNALVGISWHLFNSGLYSNGNFLANEPGAPWGYPLWYADPSDTPPPPASAMVQYSWTQEYPGVTGPVDGDLWLGTEDDYAGLFGSPPVTPEPAPVPADISLPTLAPGMIHATVKTAKALLHAWGGYDLPPTFLFDEDTARAVSDYRTRSGLPQGTEIGQDTWVKLLKGPAG